MQSSFPVKKRHCLPSIVALFAVALSLHAEDRPAGPVKKEAFDWGDGTQPPGGGTPKAGAGKRPVGRATPPAEKPAPAPSPPEAAPAAKAPEPPAPTEERPSNPKGSEEVKSGPLPTSAGKDEPAVFAATFFAHLQKGHVDDAYTSLTKGSKIAERPDELKALKAKTNEAIQMFGIFQGYDLIESKSVGSHILRRTYLSLGKEFPLRWRFYFYKNENRWRLVDLRVDDRLTGIFDEADEKDDATAVK